MKNNRVIAKNPIQLSSSWMIQVGKANVQLQHTSSTCGRVNLVCVYGLPHAQAPLMTRSDADQMTLGSRRAAIAIMETTDARRRHHLACALRVHRPGNWGVALERQMGTYRVIIVQVGGHEPIKMGY